MNDSLPIEVLESMAYTVEIVLSIKMPVMKLMRHHHSHFPTKLLVEADLKLREIKDEPK